MSTFRVTRIGITANFNHVEARLLAQLATRIASLLAERDDDTDDTAVRRLLPGGYDDDDTPDAQEFRRFTEDDLADDKIRGALVIAEALDPASNHADSHKAVRVTIDADEAFVWLRSLNDIRLVLGDQLGLTHESEPVLGTAELVATYELFRWLSELQYSPIEALDR